MKLFKLLNLESTAKHVKKKIKLHSDDAACGKRGWEMRPGIIKDEMETLCRPRLVCITLILAGSLGSGTIWSPVWTEMGNGISRSNTAAFVSFNQPTEKLKMKGKLFLMMMLRMIIIIIATITMKRHLERLKARRLFWM